MEITFLGVGEACDPFTPNTSLLIEDTGRELQFLLDCGFTVPHAYFAVENNPDALDFLWISHFHGDHFFGVPLLLLRLWEGGRKKPLFILGQEGIEEVIRQTLSLAYAGFEKRFAFSLHFISLAPGKEMNHDGVVLRAEENEHSKRNLSIRAEHENKAIFYSGDGRPTAATERLAAGCDLVAHEAFSLDDDRPGHGNIEACMDFAERVGAARLALVHISHRDRIHKMDRIQALVSSVRNPVCFVPETGQKVFM